MVGLRLRLEAETLIRIPGIERRLWLPSLWQTDTTPRLTLRCCGWGLKYAER
jgi:hypothetical protein